MRDAIRWEILEDGTVSIETDAVSGANHRSADELLEQLAELLGGAVEVKKRDRLNVSLRGALEAHAHDGHVHTH